METEEAATLDLVRRFLDNNLRREEREEILTMLRTNTGNVEELLRIELDRRFMGYFDDPTSHYIPAAERRRGDSVRRRVYKKIIQPQAKRRWIEPWHLQGRLDPSVSDGGAAAVALADPPTTPLSAGDLPDGFRPLAEEIRDLEASRMRQALDAANGNQTRAAALIRMPLRTFQAKVKQYGLTVPPRGG